MVHFFRNPASHMTSINNAVETLKKGGVIAYPTEAVWGLGCDPDNLTALRRLLDLKNRAIEKGLILIAANWTQLAPYVLPLDENMSSRVFPTWPGPATWLLPCASRIPPELRGSHSTLAVRVTDHDLCAELCRHWGKPLVSTSANLEGKAPAKTLDQARDCFGGQVDFYLPGQTGQQQQPSIIRDAKTGQIVRP